MGRTVETGFHIAVMVLASAALVGCTSVDGTDPYALWNTYEHPAGEFHFHYLAPPWQKLHHEYAQYHPVLVIAPNGLPLEGESDYSLRLEAVAVEQDDIDAVLGETEAKWGKDGFDFGQEIELVSAGGDLGRRSEGKAGSVWVTLAFQRAGGHVAVMAVSGDLDLNGADLDLLLESLEPRPSGEE